MKLQRFTAANNQLAMLKVQQHFGPEALIYSTRKAGKEVEILAGLPGAKDNSPSDSSNLELLMQQMLTMEKNIKQLSHTINIDYYEENERNQLYYYLGKFGFRGLFRQRFVDQFIMDNDLRSGIKEAAVEEKLTTCLKSDDHELIDTQNICALVGPTGVGKTTTIIKLARRYISKYNAESLGFISTDNPEATIKSPLQTYSEIFGVDLEYANAPSELVESIDKFQNKSLILIDTNGISQRDKKKIDALTAFQARYEGNIACYLTLPCNIQDLLLDEIARAFAPLNIAGCILTKTDESISMAPAINVCLNHDLNLSYLCNGQNIYTDIAPANAREIMYEIFSAENIDKHQSTEDDLERHLRHAAHLIKESSLDRS